MNINERDLPQQSIFGQLNLKELTHILWINKLFLSVWSSLFILFSIYYSLSLNNTYTAQTTLAAASSNDMKNNLSQLAGLTSMAGIKLPGSPTGMSDKDLALSLIKSKGLLQRLIDKYDILPDLVAAYDWDINSNSISYDSSLFDHSKNQWVRKVSHPFKAMPSTQEAYKLFAKAVSVSEDTKTGVISLTVEHLSPEIAYQWSLLLIKEVNDYVADMRINEAQLSIDYLNDQITITPYPELRTLFYELIQQHTQSMMLAKVRPEYALTTLDPPLIPEEKSSPNRLLIVILSSLLGLILGTVIILARFYFLTLEDPIKLNLSNFLKINGVSNIEN